MPYISKAEREEIDPHIDALKHIVVTDGRLNYAITKLAHNYAKREGASYRVYNAIVGVLESAKLEFYRRVVAPYENHKKEQNGDIETP